MLGAFEQVQPTFLEEFRVLGRGNITGPITVLKLRIFCWKYVFREVNLLMDAITNIGYSVTDFHVWDIVRPMAACQAFLFDCTQTSCPRSYFL